MLPDDESQPLEDTPEEEVGVFDGEGDGDGDGDADEDGRRAGSAGELVADASVLNRVASDSSASRVRSSGPGTAGIIARQP